MPATPYWSGECAGRHNKQAFGNRIKLVFVSGYQQTPQFLPDIGSARLFGSQIVDFPLMQKLRKQLQLG